MATATKQLEAIHQEISERFDQNSSITVSPLEGDPPEKYEITYHINGVYRNESGEIQEKDSHSITISIPFGFPHFPPSCKPTSGIFHPDFDPAAICIGDFWEKDRSISDLIIHIGQMISGSVFSTSNAFDEEALTWYKNNSSRLPFDSTDLTAAASTIDIDSSELQISQEEDEDMMLLLDDVEEDVNLDDITLESVPDEQERSPTDFRPADENKADSSELSMDTLDESFLDSDFDFLDDEKKEEPETGDLVPPGQDLNSLSVLANNGFDPDRYKLMAKQKRFYELDSELASLSGDQLFDERDHLAQQAASALKEAREAYDFGTEFEHQGNPGKALEAFQRVEGIVSDYPGLDEDIERTAQAKELLGDWADAPSDINEGFTASADEPLDEDLPPLEPDDSDKKPGSRTFFEQTARQTSRLIPFALAIVILLVISTAGVYYYLSSSQLKQAETKFAECQSVLEQNRFSEAERQCEVALDLAKQVQVFKGGARDNLIEQIKKVLSSELLVQGLAGNILLDGKYLPKGIAKTIRAFNHFRTTGDDHFAKEDWQQAAANYSQALTIAAQKEGVGEQLLFDVTEKMKTAEFNVFLRAGTEFIDRKKWVLATQELDKALELVKQLNIENKAEIIDTISRKLAEISLATSKEQGDFEFAEGNWQKALTHYKEALASVSRSYKPGDPTLEELKQLIVKAELYYTVNNGKEAFTRSEWDEAISSYEQAITLLESNQDILKQTNTEENRKKLARVMLQASVIRDKQDAARHLKEKQYLTAIEKLQSIIDTISDSDFRDELEFKAVIKDTKMEIKNSETDMLLADKIAYLEENFKELFTQHYTASSPESLTEPSVEFDKRVGDKLIFKLVCIEVGRGRPLRLVMKYIHDLKDGSWKFYSGND